MLALCWKLATTRFNSYCICMMRIRILYQNFHLSHLQIHKIRFRCSRLSASEPVLFKPLISSVWCSLHGIIMCDIIMLWSKEMRPSEKKVVDAWESGKGFKMNLQIGHPSKFSLRAGRLVQKNWIKGSASKSCKFWYQSACIYNEKDNANVWPA